MTIRDLNAMAIVVTGDALLREQHRAFERYVEAEGDEKSSRSGTAEATEAKKRLLDTEAICQEFGALGKEC